MRNPAMIGRNQKGVMDARMLSTIWIGIAAGILGFDGPVGVLFYFAADMIVSMLLVMRFGLNVESYFVSVRSIMTIGLFANTMTFMVFWILFHNLVYIL